MFIPCNNSCFCCDRTPYIRANTAWGSILKRVGNKMGNKPTYGKVELRLTKATFTEWYVKEYRKFVKENPNERPSINRIDNKGHYELENLEIISHSENSGKDNRKREKDGKWLCGLCKRYLETSKFFVDKRNNTPHSYCKKCKYQYERKRREGNM